MHAVNLFSRNPNVSSSAEEVTDEADYVDTAGRNIPAAPGHKFPSFTRTLLPLAACWLILLTVIVLRIYFISVISVNNTKLTAEIQNLKDQNQELSRTKNNLSMQLENLTQTLTVSESKIKNLTGENQKLTKQNEELETKTNDLTDQIKNMEETWNKDNISTAQWSIDNYCPKKGNEVRTCKPCQKGWSPFQSSCYVYNNAEPSNQKTWEEARRDCRGKISDLTAVADETEKSHVSSISFPGSGINGYWIGLKAVEGKWRLTDGSELTNNTWVNQPANENQCVISLKDQGWKAVSCGDRNAWICEKKALSV
ncbi:C-type lectin domain family 4 member G-like [Kryptolebias marmoratus]|uniref:C-type lectin domain family 4 member G-like n=1 Tax=Kryptolebias marmoratus TaxID=37003 RepID=UPI0007F8FB1F|nr:C-type lectin domain family 4 member G-like [Kryptolebias marmoratus]